MHIIVKHIQIYIIQKIYYVIIQMTYKYFIYCHHKWNDRLGNAVQCFKIIINYTEYWRE